MACVWTGLNYFRITIVHSLKDGNRLLKSPYGHIPHFRASRILTLATANHKKNVRYETRALKGFGWWEHLLHPSLVMEGWRQTRPRITVGLK